MRATPQGRILTAVGLHEGEDPPMILGYADQLTRLLLTNSVLVVGRNRRFPRARRYAHDLCQRSQASRIFFTVGVRRVRL